LLRHKDGKNLRLRIIGYIEATQNEICNSNSVTKIYSDRPSESKHGLSIR